MLGAADGGGDRFNISVRLHGDFSRRMRADYSGAAHGSGWRSAGLRATFDTSRLDALLHLSLNPSVQILELSWSEGAHIGNETPHRDLHSVHSLLGGIGGDGAGDGYDDGGLNDVAFVDDARGVMIVLFVAIKGGQFINTGQHG